MEMGQNGKQKRKKREQKRASKKQEARGIEAGRG
jgi:hypothetical protein